MTEMPASDIPWLESFEIGHAEIDRQHRQLIGALNALRSRLAGGEFDNARIDCLVLRDLLHRHLGYEERLLREVAFPSLDEHLASHHAARRALDLLLSDCHDECRIGLSVDCPNRWVDLVLRKLILADLEFKSHLQARS